MVEVSAKLNEGDQNDSPLSSFGIGIKDSPDLKSLISTIEGCDMIVIFKAFANIFSIDYSKEYYDPDIRYNKKYFAEYYGIDSKTFNKWVEAFCTPNFKKSYKTKFRFYEKDWNMLITEFGQCDNGTKRPYTRGEIAKLIYGSEPSRGCKDDLDKYLKKKQRELNIFPPKIVYGFLEHMDAPKIKHTHIDRENQISDKQKLRILLTEVLKAANMDAQERHKFKKQVRKFFGIKQFIDVDLSQD